ncbi:hypothetical protein V6N13_030755 [Hibiscus sabdariffa]|uniref:Pentatricopeptide repeat-containing protein n=1 Tax=Hibiscus sabdariffa TaxID=183260 RepID=A0ABR2D662_9ROSI
MQNLQLCIDSEAKKASPFSSLSNYKIWVFFKCPSRYEIIIFFNAKFGAMMSAKKVFDKMAERTVVSWTAMISVYSQSGSFENALLVFAEMRKAGFKGNQFSYGIALKACTGLV